MQNRRPNVNCRQKESKGRKVKTGVIKGGDLYPAHINYYVADFPKPPPNIKLIKYADDITISTSGPEVVDPMNGFNIFLSQVVNYTNSKKLSVPPAKSTDLRRRSVSAILSLISSNTTSKSQSATADTSGKSTASTKMRSELKAAHQKCSLADRRPHHSRADTDMVVMNFSGTTAPVTQYVNRVDPTARKHCNNCGQTPHDIHHLFDCPSKPTTLTVESRWIATTETVKHPSMAIDETSHHQQQLRR